LASASANDQITAILTTAHVCQSSATTNANTITLSASASNAYYLDADNDGYGNPSSLVTDCAAPMGYISTSGDCNDAETGINPDALEICNGIDDNCNGQVEEGVIFINLYTDNDGDGYGAISSAVSACDLMPGYITSGGDCSDNNVNIHPGATELCSNTIDDDCDGLINEVCIPGNDEPSFASNAVAAIGVNCNIYTGTLLASTPSAPIGSSWTSGPDVWYYFTANGQGVTIKCTPNNNDIALELRTYSGELLKLANSAVGISEEYLNYGNLNLGQQYYIRVRNVNPVQIGGGFTLCTRRLTNSSNLLYTNTVVYDSGCDIVYASNGSGSSSCSISLTPLSPSGGAMIVGVGPSLPLSNFVGVNGARVQYNTVYSATITLTYTLPIGGGGFESISIPKLSNVPLNVIGHMDLDLGSIFYCPAKVDIGGTIRANTWMCDAVRYQWKFERTLNGVLQLINGLPQTIEVLGPIGTRDLVPTAIMGFTPGSEWRVQVRPIFANGVIGSYGEDYQCMKFRGTAAAMPMVDDLTEGADEKSMTEEELSPVVYPNPSRSGEFRLNWQNDQGLDTQVEIWDAQGRIVGSWRFAEMSIMELDGSAWESGVYQVRISRGKESHLLRWMKN
jgi:hypothetical protein